MAGPSKAVLFPAEQRSTMLCNQTGWLVASQQVRLPSLLTTLEMRRFRGARAAPPARCAAAAAPPKLQTWLPAAP